MERLPNDVLVSILQRTGMQHLYGSCTLVCHHWHALIWNHPTTGLFYRCFRHFQERKNRAVPHVRTDISLVALFFYLWIYPERASAFFTRTTHTRSHGFLIDQMPKAFKKLLLAGHRVKRQAPVHPKVQQFNVPSLHLLATKVGESP